MDFLRNHLLWMHLWPVEHFFLTFWCFCSMHYYKCCIWKAFSLINRYNMPLQLEIQTKADITNVGFEWLCSLMDWFKVSFKQLLWHKASITIVAFERLISFINQCNMSLQYSNVDPTQLWTVKAITQWRPPRSCIATCNKLKSILNVHSYLRTPTF